MIYKHKMPKLKQNYVKSIMMNTKNIRLNVINKINKIKSLKNIKLKLKRRIKRLNSKKCRMQNLKKNYVAIFKRLVNFGINTKN